MSSISPEVWALIVGNIGAVAFMINRFTLRIERRFVRLEMHTGLEPMEF